MSEIYLDRNFAINRWIPSPKTTTEELGKIFLMNNHPRKSSNQENLSEMRDGNYFQIMTYNVHMWEGIIGDKPVELDQSFSKIYTVIKNVNPDILCLQEVIYHESYLQKIYALGYELVISCVVNPSYRVNQLYMTMILCQSALREQLVRYAPFDSHFAPICSTRLQCFLGQRAHTFHHYQLSLSEQEDVEEKCFLKISLPAFDLICVHLTAYDRTGERRLAELKTIHQSLSMTRRSIIVGDFNMINRAEYDQQYDVYIRSLESKYGLTGTEYQYVIETCHWIDLYATLGLGSTEYSHKKSSPQVSGVWVNYSNWTNFRVDHIFAYNWSPTDFRKAKSFPWMFFQDASDHNPLILGLCRNFVSITPVSEIYQMLSLNRYRLTMGRFHNKVEEYDFSELTRFKTDVDAIDQDGYKIFFNGQPLHEINWFKLDQMTTEDPRVVVESLYDFKDPYLTGTDASCMTMGMKRGIYLSLMLRNVVSLFMPKIQSMARQENARLGELDQQIFLLYVFSMNLNDCSLKIKHLDHTECNREFLQKEDDYYRSYDLLWNGYILKVTPRRLQNQHPPSGQSPGSTIKRHEFLALEGIYLAYNGIIDPDDFDYLIIQFEQARDIANDITPTPSINPQQPFYLHISPETTITLMRIWEPSPSRSQRGGGYRKLR